MLENNSNKLMSKEGPLRELRVLVTTFLCDAISFCHKKEFYCDKNIN